MSTSRPFIGYCVMLLISSHEALGIVILCTVGIGLPLYSTLGSFKHWLVTSRRLVLVCNVFILPLFSYIFLSFFIHNTDNAVQYYSQYCHFCVSVNVKLLFEGQIIIFKTHTVIIELGLIASVYCSYRWALLQVMVKFSRSLVRVEQHNAENNISIKCTS